MRPGDGSSVLGLSIGSGIPPVVLVAPVRAREALAWSPIAVSAALPPSPPTVGACWTVALQDVFGPKAIPVQLPTMTVTAEKPVRLIVMVPDDMSLGFVRGRVSVAVSPAASVPNL